MPIVGVFGLLLALAQAAPQGYSDRERGPNVVPATHQFGGFGTAPGQFLQPAGVAIDGEDRIFVADAGRHSVQVFSLRGTPIRTWGAAGSGPGQMLFPAGIALGPGDEVYVADSGNHRVVVFDTKGTFLRQWGKRGVAPGEFSSPRWIAVRNDRVLVSETDLPRFQEFTRDGEPVRAIELPREADGRLPQLDGIAVDETGNVYLADRATHAILKFDPQGRRARRWGLWGPFPGLLSHPAGIAWRTGKLYVADQGNHRVQVFDGAGTFLLQWGRPPTNPRDGNGRFHFPGGIAVSSCSSARKS